MRLLLLHFSRCFLDCILDVITVHPEVACLHARTPEDFAPFLFQYWHLLLCCLLALLCISTLSIRPSHILLHGAANDRGKTCESSIQVHTARFCAEGLLWTHGPARHGNKSLVSLILDTAISLVVTTIPLLDISIFGMFVIPKFIKLVL